MILPSTSRSHVVAIVLLLCFTLLTGCTTGWKPDGEKSAQNSSYQQTPDGYYRVRSGDTLHAIAFKFGLDWKDIAAWNNIRSPYTIYPDQDLRLAGSKGQSSQKRASTSAATSAGTTTAKSDTNTRPSSNTTVVRAAPEKGSASTTYDNTPTPQTSTAVTVTDPDSWLWPAEGQIISNFKPDDPARKGIDIGGNEGQAVIASASGEVVYSGSGLIGYGELIIIKHSERLLSAYAHNRKRLVAEGQKVAGGERIAEMGRNDRNQAMLHFEIRLNGNPQNPLKYLPGR